MTEYVGIDFGNAMVKASVVETPDGPPKTLRLSERDPFLPLALRQGNSGYRAGWSAFSHRRRDTLHAVVSMRDRWSESTLTASLAGKSQPVTALLGEFLAATGARVQRAATDPVGVVITVPDSWDHTHWSLPVAARIAGWTPEAYVREWVAALAIAEPIAGSTAVLLSLGYSGARATLCRLGDGAWQPVRSANEPAVSGRELRKRIIAGVAESLIQRARRDPREDPESDQDLHDAVEAALYQLHRQPATAIELTLSGKSHAVPYTRESLTALTDGFPAALGRLLDRVRENIDEQNPGISETPGFSGPLIVWGELAGLLPVGEWLTGQGSVQILSLDSLAAGAARLCARIVTGRIAAAATPTAAICPQCGAHAALKRQADCPQCKQPLVTVWETLPTSAKPAKPAQPAARKAVLTLRGQAVETRKAIEADHYRLGRNPQSDWTFTDEFPGVSGAHAVISRSGDRYLLRDLGSTNGTFVNDRRLEGEHELQPGDEFLLGQTGPRIVFERMG